MSLWRPELEDGDRQLHDDQRPRPGARRLHRDERDADLRPRRDEQAGLGHGHRRQHLRAGGGLHPRPQQPGQRDDRRRQRRGLDRRRRVRLPDPGGPATNNLLLGTINGDTIGADDRTARPDSIHATTTTGTGSRSSKTTTAVKRPHGRGPDWSRVRTPQPGRGDIDVCVSNISQTATECSTNLAGQTDCVGITETDDFFGDDDSQDLLIEVDGFGPAVNTYELSVFGNVTIPASCEELMLDA